MGLGQLKALEQECNSGAESASNVISADQVLGRSRMIEVASLRPLAAKNEAKDDPGDKAADVRHIRYAPALDTIETGSVLIDELNHYPEAKNDYGGKFYCCEEETEEHKIADSVARKHYEVCAEHTRYRARRTKGGNYRRGVGEDLGERRNKPGNQIEQQKLEMPKVVFDVVAEYPEVKHVSQQVKPPAVHEH